MGIRVSALPNDKLIWLVTAYGQLRRSINTPDAPAVDVQLLSLENNELALAQVGLYDLLEIPLGSYWREQKRVHHPPQNQIEDRIFELNSSGFDEASFIQAYSKDEPTEAYARQNALQRTGERRLGHSIRKSNRYLIPPSVLKVHKKCAGTYYLDERAECGTRLFIPCLTMFLRTYGVSKRFKEFFLNNNSELALREMMYGIAYIKLKNRPEPGEYAIGLANVNNG